MYANIRFSLSYPHLLHLCADISRYPSSIPPPPNLNHQHQHQHQHFSAPQVPEWLARFCFIAHQTGLTLSTKAGPRDHNICTGRNGGWAGRWWRVGRGETLASKGGREDTPCYEQMSAGPKQQARGDAAGKASCSRGPIPAEDKLLCSSPLLTLQPNPPPPPPPPPRSCPHPRPF